MNNYVMCLIILNLYENKLFGLVVLVQFHLPINMNVLVVCCLVLANVLVIVMMSCHLNVLLVVRLVFLRVYFGLIYLIMDYFVEKKENFLFLNLGFFYYNNH